MRVAQPPTVQSAPAADRAARQAEAPTARRVLGDLASAAGDGGDPLGRLLRAKRLGHRVDVLMARRTIARSTCSDRGDCRPDGIQRAVVQRDGDEAAAPLLVDDAASLGPGQVDRETFLAELQTAVGEVADTILAEIGQTSDDCPYITYWFAYYGGRNAAQIETSVHRFAPATVDSTSWQDVVTKVADRVGEGLRNFVETGSVAAIPEELPDDLHDEEASEKIIQRCCWGDDTGAQLEESNFRRQDIPPSQSPPGLAASSLADLTAVDENVQRLLQSALSRLQPRTLKDWRGSCFLAAYEFEEAISAIGLPAKSARVVADGSDHYFVVVRVGPDSILVDPTWRQFSGDGLIPDRFSTRDVMTGTFEQVSEQLEKEAADDAVLSGNLEQLLAIYTTGLTALSKPKYFAWSGGE